MHEVHHSTLTQNEAIGAATASGGGRANSLICFKRIMTSCMNTKRVVLKTKVKGCKESQRILVNPVEDTFHSLEIDCPSIKPKLIMATYF